MWCWTWGTPLVCAPNVSSFKNFVGFYVSQNYIFFVQNFLQNFLQNLFIQINKKTDFSLVIINKTLKHPVLLIFIYTHTNIMLSYVLVF